MFDGEPKDVDGQCNAHLHIGGDAGEDHATMRCGLALNHGGFHMAEYTDEHDGQVVIISWKLDEKEKIGCDRYPIPERDET